MIFGKTELYEMDEKTVNWGFVGRRLFIERFHYLHSIKKKWGLTLPLTYLPLI